MIIRKHCISLLFFLLLCDFSASAQQPMPDNVCIGTSKSYWVNPAIHPGATYVWAINGKVVQLGNECVFTYKWNSEGTFILTLQEFSANGCAGELQTGQVLVLPPNVAENTVRIFPNPISGPEVKFQLNLPNSSPVTVDLLAPNGQLIHRIYEGELSGGSSTITYRHDLAQGIYLYQIRIDNQVFNGRLVIIRAY